MRLSVEIQEMLRQTGFVSRQSGLANTSCGGYHSMAVSVVNDMAKDLHNFLHTFTLPELEFTVTN